MKIPPALHLLSGSLVVAIVGMLLTMSPADASDVPAPAEAPAAAGPRSSSTSVTDVAEDDGPDITPATSSQCGSGYFCVWTQANYTGTIQRFATQSQYTSIVVYRVGSFYNNRSRRVFIYGDSDGSPSACYGPGVKRSSTSSWLTYAEGTYLSTATSC